MSLIYNEQTKLTAGTVDRISTACFAIGVVAPITAAAFGVPGYAPGLAVVGFSLGWLFVGTCLHLVARGFLRRLKP